MAFCRPFPFRQRKFPGVYQHTLLLLALLILSGRAAALDLFPFGTGLVEIQPPASILWLEDARTQHSPQDIHRAWQEGRFLPLDRATPGFSDSTIWLTFELTNRGADDQVFVEPENRMTQEFHVYTLQNGRLVPARRHHPSGFRATVPLARGLSQRAFVSLQTRDLPDYQIRITDRRGAGIRDRVEESILALVFGIVMSLILYNGFLLVSLRDMTYLYYILFAGSNLIVSMVSVNFPWRIFDLPGTAMRHYVHLYRPLAPLTAFAFAYVFLQLDKYPVLRRTFKGYMGILVFLMVWHLLIPTQWALIAGLTDPLFLLGILLLLWAGIVSWLREHYQPALYFTIAQGTFLFGILLYMLSAYGVLDASNPLIKTIHLSMQAVEMLLMSLALAYRIRLAEKARTERDQERLMNEKLKTLLRMCVHDVRNPLAVVEMSIRQPDKNQDVIRRSVKKISDILELTRKKEAYDSGVWVPEITRVELAEVMEEIRFHYRLLAAGKGVELVLPEGNPGAILADRVTFIHEVLGNVVSNAIKFSYRNSEVCIEVSRFEDAITLTVSDRGTGIPDAVLADIFSENARPRPGTEGETGIGYGMPLVKRFAEATGGTLRIVTRPREKYGENSGTDVIITMPAAR